jgi:hypothetical protein
MNPPPKADVQDLSVSLPKPFELIRQFWPAGASVRQLADEQRQRFDVSGDPQGACKRNRPHARPRSNLDRSYHSIKSAKNC